MMIRIDRFEDDFAVLEISSEDGSVVYKNLPAAWLPSDAETGDVLRKVEGQYEIDEKETRRLREEAAERLANPQNV